MSAITLPRWRDRPARRPRRALHDLRRGLLARRAPDRAAHAGCADARPRARGRVLLRAARARSASRSVTTCATRRRATWSSSRAASRARVLRTAPTQPAPSARGHLPGGFERYFAELAPLLPPAARGARLRGPRRAAGALRPEHGHGHGGDDLRAGGPYSPGMSTPARPAARRRARRARSTPRGRWRWRPRGRCWPSAGRELLSGAGDEADLAARAQQRVDDAARPRLRRVLNATGVIVHTNLGRAPLAAAARAAVARAAEGYSNLELDLAAGERGSRHDHVEALLCELTGAEAAIAVNNCAGATLLAAAALAGPGREVVVSRGQLVEIGGGVPRPRRDRAGGRPAGRGRHHQPDAPRGLRARDRRAHRRDPARAPVELPPARLRRRRSRSRSCASSACR